MAIAVQNAQALLPKEQIRSCKGGLELTMVRSTKTAVEVAQVLRLTIEDGLVTNVTVARLTSLPHAYQRGR